VGRLDPVFKADLQLREVQIVQPEIDRLIVRYVPARSFDRASLFQIEDGLRERMGDIRVDFEEIDRIPRGPNGKCKAVVCLLDEEAKASLPRCAKARAHC
jgi:phenylacetate-CoA ligase